MSFYKNRHSVIPVSLFIWLLAVVVWLAWSPFEFRTESGPQFSLRPVLDVYFAGHLLFLGPIAVFLTVWARRGQWRYPVLFPWMMASVLAIVLEVGQLPLVGRQVAFHDAALGSLGALVAVLAARMAMFRGWSCRGVLILAAGLTFLAVALSMYIGAVFPDRSFRLAGWNGSYMVLAGDETDGTRKYLGEIHDARLCTEGAEEKFCILPQADRAERTRFVRLARLNQEVSISALVISKSDYQSGPARIVTFSRGTGLRNVTLAQSGQDLVFRVRTPWTGANGNHPQFVLQDVIAGHSPVRVKAVFSKGTITMSVQEEDVHMRGVYPDNGIDPVLAAVGDTRHSQFFVGRGAVFGAIVAFSGLGMGIAWTLRGWSILRWSMPPLAAVSALIMHDAVVPGIGMPSLSVIKLAGISAFAGALLFVITDNKSYQFSIHEKEYRI